jgi:hypothetical protein
MIDVETLPFEIWGMILFWVNENTLIELMRVNKYF